MSIIWIYLKTYLICFLIHFQFFNAINKADISNNIQFCVNMLLIHLNEYQGVGLDGKIMYRFLMDRWTDFQSIFSLVMDKNSFCLSVPLTAFTLDFCHFNLYVMLWYFINWKFLVSIEYRSYCNWMNPADEHIR